MIGLETKTTAELAQRRCDDLSRRLDLILAEISALRRKVDALDRCPVADMVAERRYRNARLRSPSNVGSAIKYSPDQWRRQAARLGIQRGITYLGGGADEV